jgi:hypothetical protein
VLAVGIDWSEDFHLVALGRPGEGVFEVRRVEHSPNAVDALVGRIAALEPEPAEVRVVLESRHGLLVERLLDAGYVVVPVNPDLVARRRGPAKKKDDAEDARIACLLALDRFERLRPLIPHGEDLIATFPAALAQAPRAELLSFARGCRHGWPERLADKVAAALAGDHVQPRPYLVRAKHDTIRLTASQLLAIGQQRRAWERRMGELLLGAPRQGRARRPRHLGDAVQQWAFCSLRGSPWARQFSDGKRAAGKGHHAALRALGNRWLEVLSHYLQRGLRHDEAVHAANRNRPLQPLTEAA